MIENKNAIIPRDYQFKGIQDIFYGWTETDILFFVLATGGGKTVTFVEIIKQFLKQGKRVMLIAHREELITQACKTLYKNKIMAGVIQGAQKTNYDLPAQVCSIQTIVRREKLPPADLIVIDEGHHATNTNSYSKLLLKYPDAKVLLVSATPYRLSGEGFENLIPGKQTKLIVNATLRKLIDNGYLVPIRYFIAALPDLSNVHLTKGDYNEEESYDAMKMVPIVESYLEHAKGKKGICFAINVKHSKDIVDQFKSINVNAVHLDANTPTLERQKIVDDFRSGLIDIIVNIGILTEGSDFPNCEFILLARPTKSLSLFLQMIGRGTRILDGLISGVNDKDERLKLIAESSKPNCIVLDCVGAFIDHNFPDYDHDWEYYFKGKKNADKKSKLIDEDQIEILVYVAEDSNGKKIRTNQPKEIEGMKLIEVTNEIRKKVINIKSIKEFDRIYSIHKRLPKINRPGITSLTEYMKFCSKENILIVDEIWNYLYNVLVKKINDTIEQMQKSQSINQAIPHNVFENYVKAVSNEGLTKGHFYKIKNEYYQKNKSQLDDYVKAQLSTNIV